MCRALDEWEQEKLEAGRLQGLEIGRLQGKEVRKLLIKIILQSGITIEQVIESTSISLEEIKEIQKEC